MSISVPLDSSRLSPGSYVAGGRSAQKLRTRADLLAAARAELAAGRAVTVESVAAVAGVSRTTAYRYFANHRDLVAAAHPQIDLDSLLPSDPPADVEQRLMMVLDRFLREVTVAWEPQLRAALRLALEPAPEGSDGGPGRLRQGRGIGWFLEALEPLATTHPGIDRALLARAIRSAAGIESLIWLTDVGGLAREQAIDVMRGSARAILREALRAGCAPGQPVAHSGQQGE